MRLIRRISRTATRGLLDVGDWPPLAKLAFSGLLTAAVGGSVQSLASLAGIQFDILSSSGRGVLIGAALASLMFLLVNDRLGAAAYGLSVGDRWQRQCLAGLCLGILVYSSHCVVATFWGAFSIRTGFLTPYRCVSAGLAACAAIPVAVTQQVIFSGYLLSILRTRYRAAASVGGTALCFALLAGLLNGGDLMSVANLRFSVGMLLIGAMLASLRLYFGSIVFPAGVLAGCIAVRRLLRKTRLLAPDGGSAAAAWLAPDGDPRQSPVLWIVVGIAIVVCLRLLRRHGEAESSADAPALSASFKRIVPFSNLMALAPLDIWIGRLIEARFRVGLVYVPRLLFILTVSAVNTILSLPERILLPRLLRHRVPDPIFVVGVHRSGTTHLHNLLALDPQWVAPRNLHVLNPFGSLLTGWIITPLLGIFMTTKRPMDGVRFTIASPQEDEFAVAGMDKRSPYWGITFPRHVGRYDRYIFLDSLPPDEIRMWQSRFMHFLRQLTFWSRKRPLLKSPYHTGRVAVLRALFPRAKFIHICRHPYDTYRSNMHLARHGWAVFQLQAPCQEDSYQTRFLDNYRALEQAYYRDVAQLPPADAAEVRFEDLERDPVGEIRRVYAQLDLEYGLPFHRRLEDYLKIISGYQKNRLSGLSEPERRSIDAKMGRFMMQWGYERREMERSRTLTRSA